MSRRGRMHQYGDTLYPEAFCLDLNWLATRTNWIRGLLVDLVESQRVVAHGVLDSNRDLAMQQFP